MEIESLVSSLKVNSQKDHQISNQGGQDKSAQSFTEFVVTCHYYTFDRYFC